MKGRTWSVVRTIAREEFRAQVRSPLFVLLIAAMAALLPALNPTGVAGSSEGGVRPFVNSPFAIVQFVAISSFFVYPFFVAMLAGQAVLRDDEAGITDLIRTGGTSPRAWMGGKCLAIGAAQAIAIAVQAALMLFWIELAPLGGEAAGRGPFRAEVHGLAMLLVVVPLVMLLAGAAAVVALRTRSAMAVATIPILALLGVLFVLWTWQPPWLPEWISRLLMVLDPSGLRWLNLVVFDVDRGAMYYNTAPLPFDLTILLNRIVLVLVPALLVARCTPRHWSGLEARHRRAASVEASPHHEQARDFPRQFSRAPRFHTLVHSTMRCELRELRRQPLLWLLAAFTILLLLEVAGDGTDMLGRVRMLAGGEAAVAGIEAVTLLGCLLLLFALVQALDRGRVAGMEELLRSTRLSPAARLWGNAAAAILLLGLLLLLAMGAVAAMTGGASIVPMLLVWCGVLGPTFLVWTTAILAAFAVSGRAALTWSMGIAALAGTFFCRLHGVGPWILNWPLWGALRWSDLAVFPGQGEPLLANRALMLLIAGALFGIAAGARWRQERDPLGSRPQRRLATTALVCALAAAVLAAAIHWQVRQGAAADRRNDVSWRRNVASWGSVPPPAIVKTQLQIELLPGARRMVVQGSHLLVNHSDRNIEALPFTVGDSFETLRWAVNGQAVAAMDHSGMKILRTRAPLPPGARVRVEFRYQATMPRGWPAGDAIETFILPAGVLLSTRGELIPLPGFGDIAEPFHASMSIRVPRELAVAATGSKRGERIVDGVRETHWETDFPVRALSLTAGRWQERRLGRSTVLYAPRHRVAALPILQAAELARSSYSRWFGEYPWRELRVSEVPETARIATAYPTSIVLSEGAAFRDGASEAAFLLVAHEVAHQWWGHQLAPADGPGGDVLVESLAQYSMMLLLQERSGDAARQELARQLEARYLRTRAPDRERALAETEGDDDPTAAAVIHAKGPWVFWMLERRIGRARMFAVLRDLLARSRGGDQVSIADFEDAVRRHGRSPGLDAFQKVWLHGTAMPEYVLDRVQAGKTTSGWRVSARIANRGAVTMPVDVAVAGRQGRARWRGITVPAGGSVDFAGDVAFQPDELVVDPDAGVLQLRREQARARLETSMRRLNLSAPGR